MAFNGCDIDGIPHNKRMCMGANINDSNNNSNGTGHDDVEMKTGHGLLARVKEENFDNFFFSKKFLKV